MKTALFRYAGFPMTPDMGATWRGHGTKWAYWCIWDILKALGYEVTLHDWNLPIPGGTTYDLVFSLMHLNDTDHVCKPDTFRMVRLSASEPEYHSRASGERVASVNQRRGCNLPVLRKLDLISETINQADLIILNGNEIVRRTYPQHLHERIIPMDVAAGNVRHKIIERKAIPAERAFMWHAGHGAIHKGLDLCLEAFARHPEWTLHVTGNLRPEPGFMLEFAREFCLPNIHYHGWQLVSGPAFRELIDECFAFIFPSCSEGQSPAVATCLQFGLYPIISHQSGIDLPCGCGLYLDELTISDVEDKAQRVMNMSDEQLLSEIAVIQPDALWRYSRERYREVMEAHLRKALKL